MTDHDFTRTGWGHNFFSVAPVKDGVWKGQLITTPRPQIGDTMRYRTNYGVAVFEITEVEWVRDPHDMYRVTAKLKERILDA